MRNTRARLGLAAVSALAIGVIAGPVGSAQAAKVSSTAAGGAVPNATGGGALATSEGLFTQTFSLKGGKVKGKQVLDVNLTMSSSGGQDANDDLRATLVGPKGDNVGINLPFIGSSFVNLKFDDQSDLGYCNPFNTIASDCLYATGATGPGATDFASFTGTVGDNLNPTFGGGNPKGTWLLKVWDTDPNLQTATLGTSTLEVKTGKKFAK